MQRKISSFFEPKAGPSASENSIPEKVESLIESVMHVVRTNWKAHSKINVPEWEFKLGSFIPHLGKQLKFNCITLEIILRQFGNIWVRRFTGRISNRRSGVTDSLVE
jgi:hypothetical protein